jgi:hypothetical protein
MTSTPITPAMAPAGPVAAPRGPRERRVRFGHLALAIALIVVGALGTATLVVAVTAEGTYLAAARNIAYGAQFTEADLVTVRLNSAPEIRPVPANEISRVVGNYAAMPIAAGTLLTGVQVTDERFPAAGQVRIGITLPAERLPGYDVQPGDQVRLVDTTDEETATTPEDQPPPPPQSWEATVVRVERSDGGDFLGGGGAQDTTIDVIVSATEADLIARLAANDNLYLTVLPGQAGG